MRAGEGQVLGSVDWWVLHGLVSKGSESELCRVCGENVPGQREQRGDFCTFRMAEEQGNRVLPLPQLLTLTHMVTRLKCPSVQGIKAPAFTPSVAPVPEHSTSFFIRTM